MKRPSTNKTTTPTLSALAVAVLAVASAFNLTHASVIQAEGLYCVAYRTPAGKLVQTQPLASEKAALFSFEKHVQNTLIYHL